MSPTGLSIIGTTGTVVSPILLLLLNVGCFFFFSSAASNSNNATTAGDDPSNPNRKLTVSRKRKISPVVSHSPSTAPTLKNLLSTRETPNPSGSTMVGTACSTAGLISHSFKSYLRHVFSTNTSQSSGRHHHNHPYQSPSPSSSFSPGHVHIFGTTVTIAAAASADVPLKRRSFPSRNDVYPCPSCGEIFNRTHLLDLHQGTKHALAELADGDSGNNVVRIIFQTGWNRKSKETTLANSNSFRVRDEIVGVPKIPTIHRILRIQNTPKTLAKFEEYREIVKSRTAARAKERGRRSDEERCIVDGNERLQFYCTTYLCSLGKKGTLVTCGSPFCTTCEIVRHGFVGKNVNVNGIATQESGWAAHASLPEEVEKELGSMNVGKAILLCRVVAGCVRVRSDVDDASLCGSGGGNGNEMVAVVGEGKERTSVPMDTYDSVVVSRAGRRRREEELVVFDPRAVLPCFVIFYTV